MTAEKRDFDKLAASWDEEPRRVKLANDVCNAILKVITDPSGMDVLDFGCGTGLLTLRLQPLVRSITGVDSSQGMLDILKRKIEKQNLANVEVQNLDLEKGDVLQGTYNLIVSNMTLHHIKEIGTLLDAFFKALAPKGYLCIADLDLDGGMFHESNEGVFHFGFDRAALRQAFIDAGFEDVRDVTAAEMTKPDAKGEMRRFTMFLTVGRKKI
jgi:2-polyprenyl-3-methyl-5-hydroxy-6-metoxy-1,4-benzoquinol methylase